jgi:stage II sporulation protein D
MSIKQKLILIVICIFIIIGVYTVNALRTINNDNQGGNAENESFITQAEACRLLSYIDYDKNKREALPFEITYASRDMSGCYDTYVNAVWKMGLIEGNVKETPRAVLTYGYCKELIDKLVVKYPKLQEVYVNLSFDFIKVNEKMLVADFLQIYEAILTILPDEEQLIKEKTLFVLGNDVSDEGEKRVITDMGKYYYQDAVNYEAYYEEMNLKQQNETGKQAKNNSNGSAENKNIIINSENNAQQKEQKNRISKDTYKKISTGKKPDIITRYLDKGICTYVCGQEIVYVRCEAVDEIILHNVWIKQGEASKIDIYICGLDKSFQTEYPLMSRLEKVVGNITVKNQHITKISVKPDIISGKVLQSGKGYIEIDGYGKVPLEEKYKIYKVYGELSMESTNKILVGYDTTDFVVSQGKISAALIREGIRADKIRVLLKTNNYEGSYHKRVIFTANRDFTVSSSKGSMKTYQAGDKVTVKTGNKLLKEGRIIIKTASEKGRIQILSLDRSYGNPKYRGEIEISDSEEGLLLVNELSMEEYLYAVIPSEMPTKYGLEALKVQAVCARSYAYQNLVANSLSQYGAHVDDSVSYQVYNNIPENEDSVLAVKDTYGQVIKYGDDVITAFYFSTSCGHTTEPACVWNNARELPYLEGKFMTESAAGKKAVAAQDGDISRYEDLSNDKKFRDFIKSRNLTAYDSEFNWFRWHTTMNMADIKKVIDNNLLSRYNVNPELIQTLTSKKKGNKKAVYESIPVETTGNILDILVLKRGTGGIITQLLITGTKNTVKIKTEYNIRALLAPVYSTVIRQDLSKVENLSLLPSAFFVIDRNEKNGELKSITLSGGGYGHGVGMSQNGVKGMIDTGKHYDEIIDFFYKGTEIGHIYE